MPRTCPECQRRYDDEILHCPEDGADLPAIDPEDELIGRTIGSYRITRLLGAGGMGAVYLAEHPAIGSRVAIKFLHAQYSADKRIVDRFFNEARAVNLIGHDNILEILDLDVTPDNRHYFIMEFLQGRPLQDLVDPGAPVPLEVAGPILLQVCDALQAAHDHRIVHRDLKPGNVYLTVHGGRRNFVKLVDFGIARVGDLSGASTGTTQAGLVMGTPAYMSPEQASGLTARIDGRSDIYGLGCMMFQMATGSLPFAGASFGEVLIGHLQLPPPRPRKLAPAIPEAYEAVILKCLEKKQEDRFQSMREVRSGIAQVMDRLGILRELPLVEPSALGVAAAGATIPIGPPRATPGRLSRRLSRSPGAGWWLGAGAGALAIASGVALLALQQAEKGRRQAQLTAERIALQTREAARLLEEDQQRQGTEPIQLSVVSEPVGAIVEAVWSGGVKAAVTPFELFVPKNASVHFAFSKRDFLSWATDVVADSPKVVRASLLAQANAGPPLRASKAKPQRSEKKVRQASAEMKDDTIPVEF